MAYAVGGTVGKHVTFLSAVQPEKAFSSTFVTLLGIETDFRFVHCENAFPSIVVTPNVNPTVIVFGIFTSVRDDSALSTETSFLPITLYYFLS